MASKISPKSPKHFIVVLGARPNFIKAAPFFIRAKEYPNFKFTLIHTGQHYNDNMSGTFFRKLDLPKPDIQFYFNNGPRPKKISEMLRKVSGAIKRIRPDGVIVFGDVDSTLVGGLAATENKIPLIHIEAGLRSYDPRMPEEFNRIIVDHLSEILFTSEPSANKNLIKEGILSSKIKYVGNIMIESLEIFRPHISRSKIIDKLGLTPKKYVVATIHRKENTDSLNNLRLILSFLSKLNKRIKVIFPIHPSTRNQICNLGLERLLAGMHTINPIEYFDFIRLVSESFGVITDSGGIQEEASHMAIPCCTLRDNTERPITTTLGSNKLFDVSSLKISEITSHLLRSDFKKSTIPYWDSKVSRRIFSYLASR